MKRFIYSFIIVVISLYVALHLVGYYLGPSYDTRVSETIKEAKNEHQFIDSCYISCCSSNIDSIFDTNCRKLWLETYILEQINYRIFFTKKVSNDESYFIHIPCLKNGKIKDDSLRLEFYILELGSEKKIGEYNSRMQLEYDEIVVSKFMDSVMVNVYYGYGSMFERKVGSFNVNRFNPNH